MNSKLDSSAQVLYTISEVAELLKVNKNTVYQLIRCGYLRSIKFGCRKVTRKNDSFTIYWTLESVPHFVSHGFPT